MGMCAAAARLVDGSCEWDNKKGVFGEKKAKVKKWNVNAGRIMKGKEAESVSGVKRGVIRE